jgi:DNA repair photolyase
VEPKGRGTPENPTNRFESFAYEAGDYGQDPDEVPAPKTQFLRDATRTIIAHNDSPDVGFSVSVNPYRGCEHGCSYCYARPTHEYLGFSAGLDFETKILVKDRAPELLREELRKKSWQPQPIGIAGVTDAYQPAERRFGLTRACLQVLAEFRNPVVIITKNHLVTRDKDVLGELATHGAAAVFVSITTLDPDLCGKLEPRASRPQSRLDAIRELHEAKIPVGVNLAPVIPGLTDDEIAPILKAAHEAGARYAGCVPLRLPLGVSDLFTAWLERHVPERAEKVLNRVRAMRGGKLNDARFGSRMKGEGIYAETIAAQFRLFKKKAGYLSDLPLTTDAFRVPLGSGDQLALFPE